MTTKKKTTKVVKSTVPAPVAAAPTKKVQAVFYRLPAVDGKFGKEPVREWLRGDELTDDDRRVVGADIRKVEWRHPVAMPLVRSLGGGLHELRSSVPGGNETRIMFMVRKGEMVLLHGFVKKTRTTPPGDLKLGRDRMKDWKKNNP